MDRKIVEQISRTNLPIRLVATLVLLQRKLNLVTDQVKVTLLLDTTAQCERTIFWMKIHLRMIHLENSLIQD